MYKLDTNILWETRDPFEIETMYMLFTNVLDYNKGDLIDLAIVCEGYALIESDEKYADIEYKIDGNYLTAEEVHDKYRGVKCQ